MIKNFIFDLGGVILDINMQNAFDGFVALGVDPAEVAEGAPLFVLMDQYQLGLVSTEEFCWRYVEKCRPGTTGTASVCTSRNAS